MTSRSARLGLAKSTLSSAPTPLHELSTHPFALLSPHTSRLSTLPSLADPLHSLRSRKRVASASPVFPTKSSSSNAPSRPRFAPLPTHAPLLTSARTSSLSRTASARERSPPRTRTHTSAAAATLPICNIVSRASTTHPAPLSDSSPACAQHLHYLLSHQGHAHPQQRNTRPKSPSYPKMERSPEEGEKKKILRNPLLLPHACCALRLGLIVQFYLIHISILSLVHHIALPVSYKLSGQLVGAFGLLDTTSRTHVHILHPPPRKKKTKTAAFLLPHPAVASSARKQLLSH